MSVAELQSRIADGGTVVIDGATGTELERRGVPMDANAWCGLANKTHPEEVRKLHADYIRAGADVVTANTFGTAPHVLSTTDSRNEIGAINRAAIQLAQQAREEAADRPVWIAGSLSPMPALSSIVLPTDKEAQQSYLELAETLAEAGAELLICEMMTHAQNARLVVEAAHSVELPVWIGFSAETNDAGDVLPWGQQQFGLDGDFNNTLDEIVPLGADVMGIMHTSVPNTARVLEMLKELWTGPLLAYPDSGLWEPPNWHYENIVSPDEFVSNALQWVDAGVQILGGCCGLGVDHIRALKGALPAKLPA